MTKRARTKRIQVGYSVNQAFVQHLIARLIEAQVGFHVEFDAIDGEWFINADKTKWFCKLWHTMMGLKPYVNSQQIGTREKRQHNKPYTGPTRRQKAA